MDAIEVPKITDPLTLERAGEGPGGENRPGKRPRPPAGKKTPEAAPEAADLQPNKERLVDIVV